MPEAGLARAGDGPACTLTLVLEVTVRLLPGPPPAAPRYGPDDAGRLRRELGGGRPAPALFDAEGGFRLPGRPEGG